MLAKLYKTKASNPKDAGSSFPDLFLALLLNFFSLVVVFVEETLCAYRFGNFDAGLMTSGFLLFQ